MILKIKQKMKRSKQAVLKQSALKDSRGMTIIEIMVAMTIFVTFITIAVGSFVSLVRFQSQADAIINTQQTGRVLVEQISRLARQADSVVVTHSLPVHIESDHADNFYDQIVVRTAGVPDVIFSPIHDAVDGYHYIAKSNFDLTGEEIDVTKFYFDKDPANPLILKITIGLKSRIGGVTENTETEIKTAIKLSN